MMDEHQLLAQLVAELNAANSKEQLEGYFNYLAEDYAEEFAAYGLIFETCEVRD